MVSELSGVRQKLFARLLEIEEGHVAIVQTEIDAVSRTGLWFDFEEFDLENMIDDGFIREMRKKHQF